MSELALLHRIQSRLDDLDTLRELEPVPRHPKFDPLKRQVAFGPKELK